MAHANNGTRRPRFAHAGLRNPQTGIFRDRLQRLSKKASSLDPFP